MASPQQPCTGQCRALKGDFCCYQQKQLFRAQLGEEFKKIQMMKLHFEELLQFMSSFVFALKSQKHTRVVFGVAVMGAGSQQRPWDCPPQWLCLQSLLSAGAAP